MTRSRSVSALTVVVVAVWLATVCGPPAAFLAWRQQRLVVVGSPEAQAGWDAFRADMRKQSGRDGPVQRKVPKSAEPPELVWLRDYAHLAVIAWVALVGVLGGFLAAVVIGVARGVPPLRSAAQNQPPGQRDDEKQHQRDAQHTDE
ncbi:MAG: hypothetical protein K8S94_12800 [Planctomycetia bacterium]|nr:hypothetical protein [Planctomycetia bacterium]